MSVDMRLPALPRAGGAASRGAGGRTVCDSSIFSAMIIRPPIPTETAALAALWHESWRESHVRLLPPELVRERTLERFHQRIEAALERTRVAGPAGAPVGICMTKGDELDQLFVAREAQGTGAAAALLADGEARIAATGATMAWLACAIGNDRAARFYTKHGWHLARVMIHQAETPTGVFPLETWRFEKELTTARARPG